jgi:hypothetical protein
MKHGVVSTAVLSALMTGLAFAGDGTKKTVDFAALDTNGDGRISSTEAAAHEKLTAQFRTADADGDGSVSRAEFDQWSKMKAPASSTPATTPTNPGQ